MKTVDLDIACNILLDGGVLAFPTETVYGLGADATNEVACAKVYALKNRSRSNPLIVHVSGLEHARQFGCMTPLAERFVQKYWPGPLSIVVDSTGLASSVALAGKKTVCMRAPSHPLAQELITCSGLGIAAPSANLSSMISATKSQHVAKYFDVPILEDDSCTCGIESTIVDCRSNVPTILRDGFITYEDIESSMGIRCNRVTNSGVVPGSGYRHYSPDCPLRINARHATENEVAVNFGNSKLQGAFSLSLGENLAEAAYNFYSVMHDAERTVRMYGLAGIAFAPIQEAGIGVALNDKLRRASVEV